MNKMANIDTPRIGHASIWIAEGTSNVVQVYNQKDIGEENTKQFCYGSNPDQHWCSVLDGTFDGFNHFIVEWSVREEDRYISIYQSLSTVVYMNLWFPGAR